MRQLVAEKNLTFIVMDTLNNGTLIAVDFTLPTLGRALFEIVKLLCVYIGPFRGLFCSYSVGKNLSTILIDRGYAMKEDMPSKLQTDSSELPTCMPWFLFHGKLNCSAPF